MDSGSREFPVRDGLDLDTPNAARMYDYYLGGAHNTAADRDMAEKILSLMPDVRAVAQVNRAFLQRAVRYCVGAGIRQFLDLGSGVPTVGHVHQIAHATDPSARVAYVDNEAIAVDATRQIIDGMDTVTVSHADLRDPETVLSMPEVSGLLDFSEPIAMLLVSVLHFVADSDDPAAIVRSYRDAVAPGSYLALSHITEVAAGPQGPGVEHLYSRTSDPVWVRSPDRVAELCSGLELVDPGIVPAVDWHPDRDDAPHLPHLYAGLCRKPGTPESSTRR